MSWVRSPAVKPRNATMPVLEMAGAPTRLAYVVPPGGSTGVDGAPRDEGLEHDVAGIGDEGRRRELLEESRPRRRRIAGERDDRRPAAKDAAPAGGQLGRVRRVARDVDRRVAERAELVALGREILPAYDEAVRPGSRVELHEARAVGEYPRRARDVLAHRVADGGLAELAPIRPHVGRGIALHRHLFQRRADAALGAEHEDRGKEQLCPSLHLYASFVSNLALLSGSRDCQGSAVKGLTGRRRQHTGRA